MEGSVTQLLHEWSRGDESAVHRLLPLVYEELHRIATKHLHRERAGHTLRPTDLVSEAYLKLCSGYERDWNGRVHFFALAARSMRQILVDHARRRSSLRRGAGSRAVTLDERTFAVDRPEELVMLDEALEELSAFDPEKAKLVELYYFGGLTHREVGALVDRHANTVRRELRVAEAWIHSYLRQEDA